MAFECIDDCITERLFKAPDLDSPCHHFGQYCPQYPINDEPIMELTK